MTHMKIQSKKRKKNKKERVSIYGRIQWYFSKQKWEINLISQKYISFKFLEHISLTYNSIYKQKIFDYTAIKFQKKIPGKILCVCVEKIDKNKYIYFFHFTYSFPFL